MRPRRVLASLSLSLSLSLRRSVPLSGVSQQALSNRVTVIPSFRASLKILSPLEKAVLKGRFLLS
jgi:hypothetical protein